MMRMNGNTCIFLQALVLVYLFLTRVASFQTAAINTRVTKDSGPAISTTTARTGVPMVWKMSDKHNENDIGAATFDKIRVMVNGMPGPMATAAAEACLLKGLKLAPFAMTGPELEEATITVVDPQTGNSANVFLIPSDQVDDIVAKIQGIREATDVLLVAVDFTHPSAVNSNGQFYVAQSLPFVMGTTGGDREKLFQDVAGNVPCVIAPNMGKQIVAMQSALQDLANKYPSAFAGYTLAVTESHQKTKADTSGTAKAVIHSVQKLVGSSCNFQNPDDVKMIRNDEEAVAFGVPKSALTGHAFHTYTLTSPDGSTSFQLQHNVAGRTIYAEGTADAVQFLSRQLLRQQRSGQIQTPVVYSMINVLEAGALE